MRATAVLCQAGLLGARPITECTTACGGVWAGGTSRGRSALQRRFAAVVARARLRAVRVFESTFTGGCAQPIDTRACQNVGPRARRSAATAVIGRRREGHLATVRLCSVAVRPTRCASSDLTRARTGNQVARPSIDVGPSACQSAGATIGDGCNVRLAGRLVTIAVRRTF